MGKREKSAEILQIKARGGNQGSFVSYALSTLTLEWEKLRDAPETKADYYLIRAVTILEVFTRARIAMLVNHDKKYALRAPILVKDYRIDFDLVHSIQGRTITLGEIVGHGVQVNTFGQIIDHFSTLLELNLPDRLATAIDRWETEISGKPSSPIIPDYGAMAAHVTRLFELRHIIVHELPKFPVYKKGDVADLLSHAEAFADALETLLTLEMYGLVPLTQTEMNIDAAEKLRAKEKELDLLIDSIRSEISFWKDESAALQESQDKWLAYRNAHCDFVTYLYEGGTIRPLLWGNEAQMITSQHASTSSGLGINIGRRCSSSLAQLRISKLMERSR